MESLLSLAFDNLTSYDTGKVRKGLRQVDGLLAQICLSRATSTSTGTPGPGGGGTPGTKMTAAEKRRSAMMLGASSPATTMTTSTKELGTLKEDPAFREFFKLQDGFEWNVAHRLMTCLDRLLGKGSNGQNDLLILSTLDLIQGLLLLHPPSRALFGRELYMNLLLDLLDPSNCPAIQSTTTLTLLCALLDQPSNLRAFENLDGLLTVTSLFKQRSTGREVKVKLIEFFYFYLMPEATPAPSLSPPTATASTDATGRGPGGAEPRGGLARANSSAAGGAGGPGHYGINKSPSKHSRAQSQIQIQIRTQAQSQPQAQPQKPPELPRRSQTSSQNQSQNPVDPPRPKGTKTTSEKQALLSRYLSNVDALIEDLRGSAPFGVSAPLA